MYLKGTQKLLQTVLKVKDHSWLYYLNYMLTKENPILPLKNPTYKSKNLLHSLPCFSYAFVNIIICIYVHTYTLFCFTKIETFHAHSLATFFFPIHKISWLYFQASKYLLLFIFTKYYSSFWWITIQLLPSYTVMEHAACFQYFAITSEMHRHWNEINQDLSQRSVTY